jgi:hypothetical protein
MKSKLFGAIVAPISILGLSLALGLSTSAIGAGEERQNLDNEEISALDVTTEIGVAPWCGWYVSSASDTTDLVLEQDTTVGAPTEYTGTEIALTATAAENTAYVGPNAGLTSQPDATDCSWFDDDQKYGARYDVSADGVAFTAEALLPGVESSIVPTADDDMDFSADTDNPLKITNVGIDSCSTDGFLTSPSAEIKDTTLTTTPWEVATISVDNNNFCQWEAKYEIKIPSGMIPRYGNVTYRWTGPTLTHTLVIPETEGRE